MWLPRNKHQATSQHQTRSQTSNNVECEVWIDFVPACVLPPSQSLITTRTLMATSSAERSSSDCHGTPSVAWKRKKLKKMSCGNAMTDIADNQKEILLCFLSSLSASIRFLSSEAVVAYHVSCVSLQCFSLHFSLHLPGVLSSLSERFSLSSSLPPLFSTFVSHNVLLPFSLVPSPCSPTKHTW